MENELQDLCLMICQKSVQSSTSNRINKLLESIVNQQQNNSFKLVIQLFDCIVQHCEEVKLLLYHSCIVPTSNMIHTIESHAQNSHSIVSIGCGSGLLESQILLHSNLNVIGVDIMRNSCMFLPEDHFVLLSPKNKKYEKVNDSILMFCFGSNAQLLSLYLEDYIGSVIVLIGNMDDSTRPQCNELSGHCDWNLVSSSSVYSTSGNSFMMIYHRIHHPIDFDSL
jgi:hypothetical protein